MRVAERWLVEKAAKLDPRLVSEYLSANGWAEGSRYGPHGRLFLNSAADRVVVLPINPDLDDFCRRMTELVFVVSETEGVQPGDVINRLAGPADKNKNKFAPVGPKLAKRIGLSDFVFKTYKKVLGRTSYFRAVYISDDELSRIFGRNSSSRLARFIPLKNRRKKGRAG
jgi:hypothetical protein